MKSIMISIKPEWIVKILNGEKTIEIRKTMPKCELPCKVYIYCTKDKDKHLVNVIQYGGNFGYYCVHKNSLWRYKDIAYEGSKYLNGKVVAEFTLNTVNEVEAFENVSVQYWNNYALEKSCLNDDEISNYIGKNKNGYFWYIDDLKIYGKPKELSEFKTLPCNKPESACRNCKYLQVINTSHAYESNCFVVGGKVLTKAPQSWCYVVDEGI